jgi:hypothetical protein
LCNGGSHNRSYRAASQQTGETCVEAAAETR